MNCEFLISSLLLRKTTFLLRLFQNMTACRVFIFRGTLESELKACQVEKQSVEMKLASFEILGKEFEALAKEYCRLRQEIEMNNWALNEFSQCTGK